MRGERYQPLPYEDNIVYRIEGDGFSIKLGVGQPFMTLPEGAAPVDSLDIAGCAVAKYGSDDAKR
ncbi:hypothetical protein, partial [Cellulomonas citrea]|uniref:hypothetical protein n=1 Tax=Cellulomonas citrea TaxID=1909423 RepID=UPI001B3576A9